MHIEALHAFEDNYIWLLRNGSSVVVIDPGDDGPVLRYLNDKRLRLTAILVTHHHGDHTGGIAGLLARHPVPVFGPAKETIAAVTVPLREGDEPELPGLGKAFRVMEVPGHTRGHIAYFGHGALFCGDTLFGCGCGRIFEGTAAQMWASLDKLAALPGGTQVFCAHEYTESNVRFALAVEPGNDRLKERAVRVARLRAENRATVPSTLEEEMQTNPFLRCRLPAVAAAAESHCGRKLAGADQVFAVLREWKNVFR
jgi:hydroxyacylglutathione hydrolase